MMSILTFLVSLTLLSIIMLKFLKMFGPTSETDNPIVMLGKKITEEIEENGYTTTVLLLELLTQMLYFLMSIFLMWVSQHGNMTIGKRHALFTFYMMKESETLFDSFIVNIVINNIVSFAAIHYTSLVFWQWTKHSFVLKIAMFNKWSVMNLNFKDYNIFDIIFIGFLIGALVNIAIRGSGRIRYGDAILDREARKKAALLPNSSIKSTKKPKDILSMRFGEHTKEDNSDEEDSD